MKGLVLIHLLVLVHCCDQSALLNSHAQSGILVHDPSGLLWILVHSHDPSTLFCILVHPNDAPVVLMTTLDGLLILIYSVQL